MATSFGVHFGNSSSCIAVVRDGKVDVVANDAGDRTTPAVVAFTDHDQVVGLAAKQGIIRNAKNTIVGAKSLLGRSFNDEVAQEIIKSSAVKIVNKDDQPLYEVDYNEKTTTFTPVQIATKIYKKMMDTAESAGGLADSHDAVITVPIGFTAQQREKISEAANKAGFSVLRVISEPAAAVLAYNIGQSDVTETSNVLVYRLGGHSVDISAVAVNSGMYRILASYSDPHLGSKEINTILVTYCAQEFKRKWKCDPLENKRSVAKLRAACELCKHVLSKMPSANCSVDSLFEGIDFQSNISRARFESLCSSFFQRCLAPIDEVLKDAELQSEDVNKVIVCGGGMQIPQLKSMLASRFSQAELLNSIPPDEVIAVGAAHQASLLCGESEPLHPPLEPRSAVPCLAHDIQVQSGAPDVPPAVLVPHLTPIPFRRQIKVPLQDSQSDFCLHLLQQGDSLAKVVMKELPAGSTINIELHCRSDNSLHVKCSETTSEKSEDVLVSLS